MSDRHGRSAGVFAGVGRTFVGFGFGPIQTGLMIREAFASGSFDEAVVAEVDQSLVDAVRAAGDTVTINIAGTGGIRTETLGRCRLFNPREATDRDRIVESIRGSSEMATAIPSVDLYAAGGAASIAALLAEGARGARQRIIYASENNNDAARILRDAVARHAPGEDFSGLQILDTVIGKMSGVISTPDDMARLGLRPLVPGFPRCVLVEEFNRILVTHVTLPGFRRGISVFEEKADLLPFEEAKLFGHNAIHALLGYLARLRGYEVMSELRTDAELMGLGRAAFLEESGAALVRRHGGTGDPLFTKPGITAYAEDLLRRMTNPYLHDRVERIIRDPRRKLGWNDRFFGAMRMALDCGIEPRALALGAAAATRAAAGPTARTADYLGELWAAEADAGHRDRCLALVEEAALRLPGIERASGEAKLR
jgi:mannitol-1-phosphate 5-dehydrogenase